MSYSVEFTKDALKEITILKKSEAGAYRKLQGLLDELSEHPCTGTGKPKPLGGSRAGQWSRRITDRHRLVYSVDDEKITVLVISALGHYGDK
ncbi:MAG: Txe/YoeB family addiction module toxin [Prevotellaceae bacterium]|jgi:toxin YoeB|nr:Txe/YoeB family addiction module toxin [Prevotellaceae bacterium]